jgi:hypothetical protein
MPPEIAAFLHVDVVVATAEDNDRPPYREQPAVGV